MLVHQEEGSYLPCSSKSAKLLHKSLNSVQIWRLRSGGLGHRRRRLGGPPSGRLPEGPSCSGCVQRAEHHQHPIHQLRQRL